MSDVAEVAMDELVAQAYRAQLAPPPTPLPVLAFAATLRNPTGEYEGLPYDPAMHRGQQLVLERLAASYDAATPEADRYADFAIAGDTQSGKSWVVQVVLFWGLTQQKVDVLIGLQDMRAAGDVWSKKLKPALEKSGLTHFLPVSGSGSGGGTDVDTIHLNGGGSILFFGAGGHRGAGGIDGRSVPWIWNDELDTLPRLIINKTDARADHFFRQARRFKSSTVKGDPPDDAQSNILAAWEAGTRHHLEYPCPHCRAYTPLELEQVRADFLPEGGAGISGGPSAAHLAASTPKSAAASIRIHCLRCGAAIDDTQRQAMLPQGIDVAPGETITANGKRQGRPPEADRYSLRWTCWDNPFKPLAKTARKWRAALVEAQAGRIQDLIDVYHDDFVRPYPRDVGEEDVDAVVLADRSAAGTYARGEVPAWADFLTVSIDQQKRLLVPQAMAHSLDGRQAIVDWWLEDIVGARQEPTEEQRRAALDRVAARIAQGWPRQDAREVLVPVLVGIDIADWPAVVAPWMRGKRTWMAVHGAGADMVRKLKRSTGKKVAELAGWFDVIDYEHPRHWRCLWPHAESVKHEVNRAFRRPLGAEGSLELPRGLGVQDDLILHLTAERWEYSRELKRKAWIKHGRYNDWWDDAYYNLTLGRYWITEHPTWRPPNRRAATPPRRRSTDDEDDDGDGPVDLSWGGAGGWR